MGPAATGIAKAGPRACLVSGSGWLGEGLVLTSSVLCSQNVWAVLDLYGPVRSVSIVSSTRLEEPEGTQPPSPSSDTGSEGEEEDEGQEHGLRVRVQGLLGWRATRYQMAGSPLVLQRLRLALCVRPSVGGEDCNRDLVQLSLLLHTRARIKWVLCPQPLNSWRTMGRISSYPTGTGQPREWPATIRASSSSASPWCPICLSRCAFLPT